MDSVKSLNRIIKKELMCKHLNNGQKLINLFDLAGKIYMSNVLSIVKKYPNITVQDLNKLLPTEVIKLSDYYTLLAIELGYSFFENIIEDKELVL